MKIPSRIFIAGTDTGVGKTVVAAILTAGLQASYWKPLQCGLKEATDSEIVESLAGKHGKVLPEAYKLKEPLSPHAAAAMENVTIDLKKIKPQNDGPLVVEGAGGIMVPINENKMQVDLIQEFALPVVLVARSSLGTINHTLLSLMALRAYNIEVVGVVMNGKRNRKNRKAIEFYGNTKVLAEIELLDLGSDFDAKDIYMKYFL